MIQQNLLERLRCRFRLVARESFSAGLSVDYVGMHGRSVKYIIGTIFISGDDRHEALARPPLPFGRGLG